MRKFALAAVALAALGAAGAIAQTGITSIMQLPGGTTGQLQYNNGGRFGGVPTVTTGTLAGLPASLTAIAASTTTLASRLDQVAVSTTALSASTATLSSRLDSVAVSTTALSASTAALSLRLDSVAVSTTALSASTAALSVRLDAAASSTTTLAGRLDSVAVSTLALSASTAALSVRLDSVAAATTTLSTENIASHRIDGSTYTAAIALKQNADSDLDDLSDGSLSGSKVGSGVAAANIAAGTFGAGVVIPIAGVDLSTVITALATKASTGTDNSMTRANSLARIDPALTIVGTMTVQGADGIKASSGNFTGTGTTVFSITASSGIHMLNGRLDLEGTGAFIRFPDGTTQKTAPTAGAAAAVSSYTFMGTVSLTQTAFGACFAGSTVTLVTTGLPVTVSFSGAINYSSVNDAGLAILIDGAFPTPLSTTVGNYMTSFDNAGRCKGATFVFNAGALSAASHTFCLTANGTGGGQVDIVGRNTACTYGSALKTAAQFGATE